ncbi:MAG: hypothetical protein V2B19_04240, partial [Pseudomonadota bacterium]
MGLTRLFNGKKVFFDTSPFIYFIEKNIRYHGLVKPLFSMLDTRQAWGVTSTITLLEVLIHPLRDGNKKLAEKYKSILLKNGSEIWALIHVEIQGKSDSGFAKRMYVYNYRLFDKHDKKIVSLAVLTDERKNWKPERYG